MRSAPAGGRGRVEGRPRRRRPPRRGPRVNRATVDLPSPPRSVLPRQCMDVSVSMRRSAATSRCSCVGNDASRCGRVNARTCQDRCIEVRPHRCRDVGRVGTDVSRCGRVEVGTGRGRRLVSFRPERSRPARTTGAARCRCASLTGALPALAGTGGKSLGTWRPPLPSPGLESLRTF